MNGIGIAVLIIVALILLYIFYRLLKPYLLKYDTTLLLTGGLGAGKTLTAVKTSVILLRKQRIKIGFYNKFKRPIINKWRLLKFKIQERKYKKLTKKGKEIKKPNLDLLLKQPKPQLYSNIPIHYKKSMWKKEREWSKQLNVEHLLLFEEITEYSVVLLDEFPQIVNQFNWNLKQVQDNVNEMITFFRHYIGGYLILTAQATDDIVAQVRRKLNQAVWCFDFHAYKLFGLGLFYTIRMCDVMLNDDMSTMTTTYIEDNTRKHYGLFPPKNTYETRCYRDRYKNVLKKAIKQQRFNKLRTNEIIKIKYYQSPLDDYKYLSETQRINKLENLLKEFKENTCPQNKLTNY